MYDRPHSQADTLTFNCQTSFGESFVQADHPRTRAFSMLSKVCKRVDTRAGYISSVLAILTYQGICLVTSCGNVLTSVHSVMIPNAQSIKHMTIQV